MENVINPKKAKTPLGAIKRGLHNSKILNPSQVNNSNRIEIKRAAKRSIMGNVIIDTYPDMNWEDFDHEKYIHLKALFLQLLNSKTTGELYTSLEIENLLKFAKRVTLTRIQRNIAEGKNPDKYDMDQIYQLCDRLMNLHKLKHGEKKIIAKMDFSFVRDLT